MQKITGGIELEARGKSVVKFINAIISYGVHVDKLVISERGVTFFIALKDRHTVFRTAREHHCRLHVIKRYGIPFFIHSMKARPVILFGWIPALIAIIILSRFVWFIEVKGCKTINPDYLIEVLNDNGIKIGEPMSGFDFDMLSNSILGCHDKISWANVSRSGVKIIISINEGITVSTGDDSPSDPGDVIARSDGIITRVIASKGHPAVSVGDSVRAGDVLISGTIGTPEKPLYVRADGEVYAKVLYSFSSSVGPHLKKSVRTGKYIDMNELTVFNRKFSMLPTDNDYEIEYKTSPVEIRSFLPISVCLIRAHILEERSVKCTYDELSALAVNNATSLMLNTISAESSILSKETVIEKQSNGAVRATVNVVIEENIADM